MADYSHGMAPTRTLMDRIDRLCAWLFLVPFFVMMLMPATVMPTVGADGQMTLVICTGDGPVTMADTGADPGKLRAPCDWAMGHVDVAVTQTPLTVRPVIYERFLPATAVTLWRPAHDTRSVTARGPPATF